MKAIQLLFFVSLVTLVACSKELTPTDEIQEELVNVGDYKLYTAFNTVGATTVVFENGLGSNLSVWFAEETIQETAKHAQVIAYNRAGYAPSEESTSTRNLQNLQKDLHEVIKSKSINNQVILVGHSWGGPILRAYAEMHPEKIKGLVFIDPSHEDLKDFGQIDEDELLAIWGDGPGIEEAQQLWEGIQYLEELEGLPNVSVTVITGMQNKDMSEEERANWYNAHHSLGEGITEFRHIGAMNSGHFVMMDEPELVLNAILEMINK